MKSVYFVLNKYIPTAEHHYRTLIVLSELEFHGFNHRYCSVCLIIYGYCKQLDIRSPQTSNYDQSILQFVQKVFITFFALYIIILIFSYLYLFHILISLGELKMEKLYTCPGCGKQVAQYSIKPHINNCKQYEGFTLTKILKLDESDDLNFLKFLFEQLAVARDYIQRIIQNKRCQKQDDLGFADILLELPRNQKREIKPNQKHRRQQHSSPMFQKKRVEQKKNHLYQYEQQKPNRMSWGQQRRANRMSQQQEFLAFDARDMVKCVQCDKTFYSSFDIDRLFYIEQCWHLFCKPCIRKYIDNQFVNSGGYPKCPVKDCENIIPQHQTKTMLGDKYQSMQNKAMRKIYNVVECVKCKQLYDFVPGNPNDAPKKDQHGKFLRPQHAILYSQNRFICPRPDCKTQQCKQCQASPYHLGMDCKQYKSRALMIKCRYCDTPIGQKNANKSGIAAHSDICNQKQCQQVVKNACIKILPCSHPCSGVRGQKKCLPCLKEGCYQKQQSLMGQNGDDYCPICYVQSLTSAPSIQCGCGHVFHIKCIKKRFQIKWLTPRILFNFCVCPLCKKWIQVPPQNQLHKQVQQNKELFAKIQKMALERLKYQDCDKDKKLTQKSSPYYNKPNQYSMAIYAYFMCYKCKNPYFGGRKNCAEAMNSQQNVQGYNAKQLVCPNCCDIPIQNCPKHGTDFIQFKCKYCCSIAQWFCWGNTHFCEQCHKKQCNGDYVSKYTKEQLPKCQGHGKCPIGGDHNGNGQQKMLGCAVCRNFKQNSKKF